MTNSKIFDEIGCPDKLKDCEFELKRTKKFLKNKLILFWRWRKRLNKKIIRLKY